MAFSKANMKKVEMSNVVVSRALVSVGNLSNRAQCKRLVKFLINCTTDGSTSATVELGTATLLLEL